MGDGLTVTCWGQVLTHVLSRDYLKVASCHFFGHKHDHIKKHARMSGQDPRALMPGRQHLHNAGTFQEGIDQGKRVGI